MKLFIGAQQSMMKYKFYALQCTYKA